MLSVKGQHTFWLVSTSFLKSGLTAVLMSDLASVGKSWLISLRTRKPSSGRADTTFWPAWKLRSDKKEKNSKS